MKKRAATTEDRELFERHARCGDAAAREELVRRHIPLAHRLAGRYAGSSASMDDLVQVASLGLLRAIDRFDPELGTSFSSFAVPTILGELRRHFRDAGWAVHVPRSVQELALSVRRTEQELALELGRSPTPSELAAHMREPVERVLEAREAAGAARPLSLEAPGDELDGQEDLSLLGRLGEEDQGYAAAEARASVRQALSDLSVRDRQLLHMRFSLEMTQSEIAEHIGVSQMHVSRLLRRTLDDLHEVVA